VSPVFSRARVLRLGIASASCAGLRDESVLISTGAASPGVFASLRPNDLIWNYVRQGARNLRPGEVRRRER
jgi:hypothetical protein